MPMCLCRRTPLAQLSMYWRHTQKRPKRTDELGRARWQPRCFDFGYFALVLLFLALVRPAHAQAPAESPSPARTGAASEDATSNQQSANGPPGRGFFRIAPGAQFRDCALCPDMVVLPPGIFTMGTLPNELGHSPDEAPQHEVAIPYLLAIGRYEITFEQWDACAVERGCSNYPGDSNWGRGRRPVINVSWNDAQQYVRWLSKKTGEEYHLPTEAEWEYAARAGTQTPRFWREGEIACAFANVYDASGQRVHHLNWDSFSCIDAQQSTAPAGSFLPNNFGLYDMLGNVWEWTADCWVANYDGAPANGGGRGENFAGADCKRHVIRGGSWNSVSWSTRSGFRGWQRGSDSTYALGFRVARLSR